jgi:hypothetical protein
MTTLSRLGPRLIVLRALLSYLTPIRLRGVAFRQGDNFTDYYNFPIQITKMNA